MQSLEIVLEVGGVQVSDVEKRRLADLKNTWFNDFVERMLPEEIFAGAYTLIEKMKSSGLKVALASSSKNALTVIKRLQIETLFNVIVDGTMIKNTKPDPEIFLRAARLIEVLPDHCLVFEDAEAGVEAALAAGMKCVGVGVSDRLEKADCVIEKIGDFKLDVLKEF